MLPLLATYLSIGLLLLVGSLSEMTPEEREGVDVPSSIWFALTWPRIFLVVEE